MFEDGSYTAQSLRDGIEIELRRNPDIASATAYAMARLTENPNCYDMQKAESAEYHCPKCDSDKVQNGMNRSTGSMFMTCLECKYKRNGKNSFDLVKMEKARVTKYIKRIPNPSGKGFIYFYTKAEFDHYEKTGIAPGEKPTFHFVDTIRNFFGFKTSEEARSKIKKDFEEKVLPAHHMTIANWMSYVSEYFANKEYWDDHFTPKEKGEKKESTPKKTPKQPHGGAKPSNETLSIMKLLHEMYGNVTAKPAPHEEVTEVEETQPVETPAHEEITEVEEPEESKEPTAEPEKIKKERKVKDQKAAKIISEATPETRAKAEREINGIPEPTPEEIEATPTPKVDFVPKDTELSTREWVLRISTSQQQTMYSEKIKVKDYTDLPPNSIFLPNAKTILTDHRPSYIPEVLDKVFLVNFTRFIPTAKIGEDKYVMQIDVKRKKQVPTGRISNGIEVTMSVDDPDSSPKYIVVNRDLAAAIQDYYIKRAKALNEIQNEKFQKDYLATHPYYNGKFKKNRVTILSDDEMTRTQETLMKSFNMDDHFDATKQTLHSSWATYGQIRNDLKQKTSDMIIQLEEHYNSYSKGRETSYGDKGTKDTLLADYGVKVKRQNGDEINDAEIGEVKAALDDVFSVFGNRSSMAKNFGLKISHSGDVGMHARKASGIYFPSYKAIGVTTQYGDKATGMILAHEWAHFMDNYIGRNNNRHYLSDDPQHVAGQIASTFRQKMRTKQKSDYYNRTCECFARAMEQFWAIKTDNRAVLAQWDSLGTHPTEEIFKAEVMPLIDQFLKENDQMLKAFWRECAITDLKKALAKPSKIMTIRKTK